jgi:hypothetical protein
VGSFAVRASDPGKPRSVSGLDSRRTLCVNSYVAGLFGRRGQAVSLAGHFCYVAVSVE